jgi:hypothetical protein
MQTLYAGTCAGNPAVWSWPDVVCWYLTIALDRIHHVRLRKFLWVNFAFGKINATRRL